MDLIKLTAIGTGSAFSTNNYQTNYLVEIGNKKLLIDCGGDARHGLNELGLSYKDIYGVYVSHLHSDHVGGLEWLGFSTYFDPSCGKPMLFGSTSVVAPLWTDVLSGGMGSVQGKVVGLHDYFDVVSLPSKNGTFTVHDSGQFVKFQMVQTCHVMNGFYLVPSFGLIIDSLVEKMFITCDTQFAPEQLQDFYELVDVIVHDCETMHSGAIPIVSGVHAHYEKLRMLDPQVKEKMWLSHYQDGAEKHYDAIGDGFLGFLKKGQVVMLRTP